MAIDTLSIETPTHGRVVVRPSAGDPRATLVVFHGYAQGADEILSELITIPASSDWTIASVQALHRFYARRDERTVASWMTRQDRELAIADNIEYVNRAMKALVDADRVAGRVPPPMFVLGFSQGVAMAHRAGLLGQHQVAGIIAIGGDVPPDCKDVSADRWPRVLVAAGDSDHWFTPDKVAADETFLRAHGVAHQILRYPAAHVITDDVRHAVAAFINS